MRQLEFASLQVRDLETSKEFYTKKLGFELSEMKNPEAYIFRHNKGKASFAIRKPTGNLANKELGIGISLWFAIDGNIEELNTRLKENGVIMVGNINQTPFGETIMAKDPDGYILTFLEPV